MQNQYTRPFRNPNALNTIHPPSRFAATDARYAAAQAAPPQEEAWTRYDGLGGPEGILQGNWRHDRSPSSPGRNSAASSSRVQDVRYSGRGGPSKRNKQPSAPPKRPKKESGQGRGGGWGGGAFDSRRGELIDDAYLARHFPPFDPATYPRAPSTLRTNPKAFLWDIKQVVAKSVFATQKDGVYRCTVIITLGGAQQVQAIGEAVGKKVAEKIACKHAVLKLHKEGKLQNIISGGLHHAANDKELLNKESNAIVDVYDYCARFTKDPIISAKDVPAGRKRAVEIVIQFPEQGIKASARAQERKAAEILAAVEFKRQAEDWHAKNGDQDIVVKDIASSLNSRNSKQFFDYYKIHVSRGAQVEVRSMQNGKGRVRANVVEAQVFLNTMPYGEPVQVVGKKAMVESLAYLSGAIALRNEYPDIWPRFVEALKNGNGEILKPIPPIWLKLPQECLITMTDTLLKVRRLGLPPTEEEIEEMDERDERQTRRYGFRRTLDPALAKIKSQKMAAAYAEYQQNSELEKLRRLRSELPMNQYTNQVLSQVNGNEFSIIVGATGSGKTTQVPQIILENAIKEGKGADCNIICTQPRRIAATSVAQRVAVERNEPLQQSVGYHVRFDAKLPLPGGSISYCTTGILLQQLRNSPEEALAGITHLVIDEVHERDIMIDYLMIVLKRVVKARREAGKPQLKVVLMSATMDTELFASYFEGENEDGSRIECPSLSVPGRTFPVKEVYLDDIQQMLNRSYRPHELGIINSDRDSTAYLENERNFERNITASSKTISRAASPKDELEEDDNDATINWKQEVRISASGETSVSTEKENALVPIGLAAATVAHIAKTTDDGAILVFLPGLDEIQKVEEAMMTRRPLGVDFNDRSRYRIYLLHSSIPNQNEVFEELPEGCRKVILSTNIAETSITIPDVKYVVDTGKLREKQYDQVRRITSLVCTWVSKSNSKQRAGRAGRVQNGNYFALFSKSRYDALRAAGLPEMLRSDLQEICLDIKLQGFEDSIAQFLSEAIEPPEPWAIESSLQHLRKLGALDDEERLTPLGRALATIPVEPSLGKMIILGVIFRCLDPIIILGASAGGRDIFVNPPDKRKEATRVKHTFVENSGSDHYATVNAYRQWRHLRDVNGQHVAHRFAAENFLHHGALKTLDQTAKQIEEILGEIGIIPRRFRQERLNSSEFGDASHNVNSRSVPLIKALTLSGMYPNLAVCIGGRGFRTAGEAFAMIHPSSFHYSPNSREQAPLGALITFSAKARSNDGTAIMLRQNTASTSLAALMFGGRLRGQGNKLDLDNWVPFAATGNGGQVVSEFRKCLDRLLANAFRSLYKRDPNVTTRYLADDPAREALSEGLVDVLMVEIDDRFSREERRPLDSYTPGGPLRSFSQSRDRFQGDRYVPDRDRFSDRGGNSRGGSRGGSEYGDSPHNRSRAGTPFGPNGRWR